MRNGTIKCKVKKRVRVALDTVKPPQTHATIVGPTKGIAESRLVMTVAPQNLICPQGNTYPTKATAILKM